MSVEGFLFRQRPGPDRCSKASPLNFTRFSNTPNVTTPVRWSRRTAMGFRCRLTTALRILGRLFLQLPWGRRIFLTVASGENRETRKGEFFFIDFELTKSCVVVNRFGLFNKFPVECDENVKIVCMLLFN